MFTVALVGPDGAGKTTVSRELVNQLPIPVKYVYMGINLEASNMVLPTTRLLLEIKRRRGGRPDMAGPPDPSKRKRPPKGKLKRALFELKAWARLLNRMAEASFRQCVVWWYQARGYVVLFDRHFFLDYYAHDIANPDPNRHLTSRVHGWFLQHVYPKPHLVICLDAPPEVLFARKGEGSLELLERRRQEYLQFRGAVKHFYLVDATRPLDQVVSEGRRIIMEFYAAVGSPPVYERQ